MQLRQLPCSTSAVLQQRHTQMRPVLLPARQQQARARQRAAQTNTALTQNSQQDDQVVPPGCSRYSISIKKPLGLVLEQNKDTGVITVVELAPEGPAAKAGVSVGDQLIATSGVVYNKESDYGGAKVKMGQQVVRMTVLGESFKTVAAAIGSHPGHMEVKLEFQRC